MLKWITRIGIGLISLICLILASLYFYAQSCKPEYQGRRTLKGLKQEVTIYFDDYGIPHIYALNEPDAYYALGYVHAQERLFQMDMIRHVGAGRLSELLGKDFIQIDRFLRTLGIEAHAKASASTYMRDTTNAYQKAAIAYVNGINSFIDQGKLPVEYKLIGIPKSYFTVDDLYLVSGYMSFSFALAFKTDPLCQGIYGLGKKYLNELSPHYVEGTERIPCSKSNIRSDSSLLCINEMLNLLPVAPWIGSNAFVAAPSRTQNGKVLFGNDTHIAYAQPSVWYEAHLEYPGQSFYGNFLAGFPFAAIGHNQKIAWGLTILEQDDVDFYIEKQNPENENEYLTPDGWATYEIRKETVKVKGGDDVHFEVKHTRHGPVMNSVMEDLTEVERNPVSMFWVHTKFPSTLLHVTYELAHAQNITDAEGAVAKIISPGLNVMYGDADGNIAWWAAAKLMKRKPHVNPVLFLDGSSGKDDIVGYYDFKDNPHGINPASGFLYSANNQPDSMQGILYPGYYVPDDRAQKIVTYAGLKEKLTVADFKEWQGDVISNEHARYAHSFFEWIQSNPSVGKDQVSIQALNALKNWNGSHEVNDIGPTVYYKLLYHMWQMSVADELGEKPFLTFLNTHLMKNAIRVFIYNEQSEWWDHIKTEAKETRNDIMLQAFKRSIEQLQHQLGNNVNDWSWGRVHTLEHINPVGRQKPLNEFFNVGPLAAPGGMETLNNSGFQLNADGLYPATFGPSMRVIIDFADIEHSISINPTGQSGVFSSEHYDDQALAYINCKYRKQMMNKKEITETGKNKLILSPR